MSIQKNNIKLEKILFQRSLDSKRRRPPHWWLAGSRFRAQTFLENQQQRNSSPHKQVPNNNIYNNSKAKI
jgi:hypothetical protein